MRRCDNNVEDIPGWLDPREAYALYLWACHGRGDGDIVEIGAYMGRSACWLASGAKATESEKVVAVDNFSISPDPDHLSVAAESVGESQLQAIFENNLKRVGLRDWIDLRVGESTEVAKNWMGPIRLLFIDGDHSYASVRSDVESWAKHVVPGGVLVFHDVGVFEGVTKLYNEVLELNSHIREVCRVHSLGVVEVVG